MATTRLKKKPERYGETVNNLSAQSGESESVADDSVEDKSYSPDSDVRNSTTFQSDISSITDCSMNFESQFEKVDENFILESTSNSIQKVSTNRTNSEHQLNDASFQLEVLNQLKMLNNRTIQILARIGVIEDSLIKSGRIVSVQKEEEKNNEFAIFNDYAESKKMPFKTVTEFKEFENSLSTKSMENAV